MYIRVSIASIIILQYNYMCIICVITSFIAVNYYYIQVHSLAENYSNYLSVPPGPHHVLHIHYPFVLHNYLHNKLRVSGTDILSGSFVNVSHINPEKETKLPIEV